MTPASSPVFRVGQFYLLTTHQCCVMQSRTRSGNLRKVWPVYPGNLTAWHWCFGVQSGRDIAWPCAVFLATFLYRRQREKTFQFYIYIKVIYIKRQTPRYIQRGPRGSVYLSFKKLFLCKIRTISRNTKNIYKGIHFFLNINWPKNCFLFDYCLKSR